ncbi:MAG TPA: alpha/beta fold hydrolase [Acidimicrobiales bacterium]|nr:alpha/beta fold hydrolase [Acidimicrobiales bacterium]
MTAPILPGAEPWSAPGGPDGALVLHGFTGNPQSMRGVAQALAGAGFAVELPLLPGHGTSVEDMVPTRWDDWSKAAEREYAELAARCRRVVVVGLSMGGTLAVWLATHHPEIAGLVAINPFVEPPAESFLDILRGTLEAGTETMPGVGSDIALEGVEELAYASSPVAPMISLMEATEAVAADLGRIRCPVLLLSSRQDHVVPSASGDLLEAQVGGPIERVWLEKSFHVATLDHDRALLEARVVEFAAKVAAA